MAVVDICDADFRASGEAGTCNYVGLLIGESRRCRSEFNKRTEDVGNSVRHIEYGPTPHLTLPKGRIIESSDDAKVVGAAFECDPEVCIRRFVGLDNSAVREHNLVID